ncbi:MAG TPA: hypothetical protein VIH21_04660 [Dehalococcoidia bacterium]
MNSASPITDEHGRAMFHCAVCRRPLTNDDFFELGLRLPDRFETAGDYFDAELIDELEHPECTHARRAG